MRRRPVDPRAVQPPPASEQDRVDLVICVIVHPQGHPVDQAGVTLLPGPWRPIQTAICPADLGFVPGTLGRQGQCLDMFVLGDQRRGPGELALVDPVGAVDIRSQTVDTTILVGLTPPPSQPIAPASQLGSVPGQARAELECFLTSLTGQELVHLAWRDRAAATREIATSRTLFEEADHE